MGFIDAIVMGVAGMVTLNKDKRSMDARNQRRQSWLSEHGYDIEQQIEVERWCGDNIEVAIEQAYGYAYRTIPWDKIYRQYQRGNGIVQREIYKRICSLHGLNYFDFRSPPREYMKIK